MKTQFQRPYNYPSIPSIYDRGLGDCTNGYDEYGVACTDFTPITNDQLATAIANQYINSPSPNMLYSSNTRPTSSNLFSNPWFYGILALTGVLILSRRR